MSGQSICACNWGTNNESEYDSQILFKPQLTHQTIDDLHRSNLKIENYEKVIVEFNDHEPQENLQAFSPACPPSFAPAYSP